MNIEEFHTAAYLLQKVLNENYDLEKSWELKPETRDEIEKFLHKTECVEPKDRFSRFIGTSVFSDKKK